MAIIPPRLDDRGFADLRADLILLDGMMPDMDGYAVLRALQGGVRTSAVPVIFVTALGSEGDEERGLSLGACDYIAKPIKPAVVLARVRTQLELKAARDRLADQNAWLEAEVARRVHDSQVAQDLTLCALAELTETRDVETGNHILRTQAYVEALGRELQRDPAHVAALADGRLELMVKAAPMHDIGKIGIPDRILLKPGRLTEDEFEQMKTHARLGSDALARALHKVTQMHASGGGGEEPESVRFLQMAQVIAQGHHERWDGLGYPDALAGDRIPLAARLMALADVYDALTTARVYKDAWTPQATADYIERESGRHFDPRLVQAFRAVRAQFEAIAQRLAD
jgi:putative two-component system response regulator